MADEIKERLAGYSGYGETSPEEAFDLLDEAREKCPVAHSDQLGGFHMLLAYEDVRKAHADPETFSSSDGMFRPVVDRLMIPPTEYDNPTHDEWREGVFDSAINAQTPKRIADDFRADANELIDTFAGDGMVELVSQYTDELPLRAICRILGFDIDKGPELRELTVNLMINLGNPDGSGAAMKALADFGAKEVAERRENPRDDFLTELTTATLRGNPLTEQEISQVVASLVSGGHETTVAALTNVLFEVLSRPGIKQQLIDDPGLIPAAVEEALRFHPPFMGFYRRATEPTEVKGEKIAKDEHVMLCWASANRDPEQFEDPLEFRLDRPNLKRHMSFGYGLHFCIGAPTARMELCVATEELLRRLPEIELADAESVRMQFGGGENVFIPKLDAVFPAA